MYVWRRRMHVSYNEMLVTPIDVILADLDMIGIEQKYNKADEPKSDNIKGNRKG